MIPGSLGPNCEPSLGRWMSKLWNAVIAPRVQEAILSRASVKRQPGLGQTTKNPSQGQQAVVDGHPESCGEGGGLCPWPSVPSLLGGPQPELLGLASDWWPQDGGSPARVGTAWMAGRVLGRDLTSRDRSI